jgi:hypothetical protein
MSCSAKSENLLFAGLISKKGQAKLALFWGKSNETPQPGRFCTAKYGLSA